MRGINRTLRPELGHGGKQTHRDGNLTGHTRLGPAHVHTPVGVSDDRIEVGVGVDPLETKRSELHEPTGPSSDETRQDKDREDSRPLTLASVYASVYDDNDVDQSLQGNSSNSRPTAEVKAFQGYVFVDVQTEPNNAGKHSYVTLQLRAADAKAFAATIAAGAGLAEYGIDGPVRPAR